MKNLFYIKNYLIILFAGFVFFALFNSFYSAAASTTNTTTAPLRMVVRQGDFSYENATITEDVTWRGIVLIRGSLVVSAHATVRIEPGTVIRFLRSPVMRQTPQMVVMGRLECSGNQKNPVIFTSGSAQAVRGEWGGLLFLSTEKRNQMEHFLIEGADTAIEAHYSQLNVNGAKIRSSGTGILLQDSIATLSRVDINGLDTGLETHNSELDLRDSVIAENSKGLVAGNTSISAVSTDFVENRRQGVVANDCRVRLRSCKFTDNAVGAILKGGEGQLFWCRFSGNRELALEMSASRTKVNNCLFIKNMRDAIKVSNSYSLIQGSSFISNAGFNIVNAGADNVIAIQNWWDTKEESEIIEKISDALKNPASGRVVFSPWMMQKPSLLP